MILCAVTPAANVSMKGVIADTWPGLSQKTLKRIADHKLGSTGIPPGQVDGRLPFLLMNRLAAIPFLNVEIRAQLDRFQSEIGWFA